MKKENSFKIAKVQPQDVAYLLLNFFANFSLVVLRKVLPINKRLFLVFIQTSIRRI